MSTKRRLMLVGVGAAAVVGGVGIAWWLRADDDPKREMPEGRGSVLCPAEINKIGADTANVHAGDFVVVELATEDRSFSEPTWATVVSTGPHTMLVRIAGEQLETGIRPLATSKHGFRLGDQLLIARDCVFDVFAPSHLVGQILCGPALAVLDDPELLTVPEAFSVGVGDRARVVVGSEEAFGTAWWEPLWTRITRMSPTGQVLTAIVDEDPGLEQHRLRRGSVLRYNRDCVVEV